jgi:hypothetical protein
MMKYRKTAHSKYEHTQTERESERENESRALGDNNNKKTKNLSPSSPRRPKQSVPHRWITMTSLITVFQNYHRRM